MESPAEYRARKREELALLRRAAGEPDGADSPSLTGAALVAEKQSLRARILARAILADPALVESRPAAAHPIGALEDAIGRPLGDGRPGRLRWGYQRYDLIYQRRPFLAAAHSRWSNGQPPDCPPVVSLGVLAGSGMAAVSAALSALDGVLGPRAIVAAPMIRADEIVAAPTIRADEIVAAPTNTADESIAAPTNSTDEIVAAPTIADRAIAAAPTHPRPLLIAPDAYFETLLAASRLRHLRIEHLPAPPSLPSALDPTHLDGAVLWLDSYCARSPLALLETLAPALDRLAAIACDTTCWDAADPAIARVIAVAARARVPLVLVRSHLKLDQLGLEYGRLGSVVIVLGARPHAAQVRLARRLRLRLLQALALSGGGFSPLSLFPLADDPAFLDLNARRDRALVAANTHAARALDAALSDSLTRVDAFHHGCFLVLRPLLDTTHYVTTAGRRLVERLVAAGLDARAAPSFAYDFIAVTRVSASGGTSHALRLAVPDLDRDALGRLVEVVADFARPLSPVEPL